MKKGFTLAEVLITLAIIGVVAALTIPVVVQKYQQKQLYTQFMKTFNTLSTAFNLSVAENGTTDVWEIREYDESSGKDEQVWNNDKFEKYLGKYLRVQSYCAGNPSACSVTSNMKIGFLNVDTSGAEEGEDGLNVYEGFQDNNAVAVLLQDGTLIYSESFGLLIVDTNGIKGPNILGRDAFFFGFDENKFQPVGPSGSEIPYSTVEEFENGEIYFNCSTSTQSMGLGCGKRLIIENKMNY